MRPVNSLQLDSTLSLEVEPYLMGYEMQIKIASTRHKIRFAGPGGNNDENRRVSRPL